MNTPICVRDGCETGIIRIGRFDFEIDLSELLEIVGAANLELRDSLLSNRDVLDNSLCCIRDILHIEMRTAQKPTDSDTAKNLKRWQDTGCGGHTDLSGIQDIILKDRQDRKALHAARELERDLAWQAVREEREATWEAEMEEFRIKSMKKSLDLLVCHKDLDCSRCENEEECFHLTEKIDKLESE